MYIDTAEFDTCKEIGFYSIIRKDDDKTICDFDLTELDTAIHVLFTLRDRYSKQDFALYKYNCCVDIVDCVRFM